MVEAHLTADGERTRLVVEERGLPLDVLPFHGAGWQTHPEDLGRYRKLGKHVRYELDAVMRWFHGPETHA